VVADDVDMRISLVIRGDDHISNTPKQLPLYRAFAAEVPEFAHVPLILGPDKKRLSKRHGATSVTEYRRQGYLPEAMVNFLALLGWSPGDGAEIMSRAELIERFALEGISGGNAVFNAEKLEWMNTQHIMLASGAELLERIEPWLAEADWWTPPSDSARRAWLARVVDLVKPRVRRLPDLVEQLRPYVTDSIEYDEAAVVRYLGAPDLADGVAALAVAYRELDHFDAADAETALRTTATTRGVKAATLIHATRVAVTGQAVSPSLFDVLAILGRGRTLARLGELERFLRARANTGSAANG
jgi:glutamyl/glutaminyl-tRNA synthetase